MDQPERSPAARLAASIGKYASMLGGFSCAWFAWKSSDWPVIIGLTALAGLAGIAAQAFARMER